MTPATSSPVLLIESRDPFGRAANGFCASLARALAASGQPASVLLVQNGVLAARRGARAEDLGTLLAAGVPVFADTFSLAERGIAPAELREGVRAMALDMVIDRLVEGWKVLWH